MPTKARRPSVEVVTRWIADGFGQGLGAEYKPFMYVRDVPSVGLSSMLTSRLTRRTHHYLSKLELSVHLLAEFEEGTQDIREQFALLPWDETQQIADDTGIRHPIYPGTRTPIVMTTDLLITQVKDGRVAHRAISVKPAGDFSLRTTDKLWIEQMYWKRRGVEWRLVTEEDIPKHKAVNLKFFELARITDVCSSVRVSPREFSQRFEQLWQRDKRYIELLSAAARSVGVDNETAHLLMGKAVWARESALDIDSSSLSHRSLVVLKH